MLYSIEYDEVDVIVIYKGWHTPKVVYIFYFIFIDKKNEMNVNWLSWWMNRVKFFV